MEPRAVLFFASRFWPGLQPLWHRGDFHSLLVSLLFSWIFAIAWLATFVWPEWLTVFFSPHWLAQIALSSLWIFVVASSLLSAIGAICPLFGNEGIGASERQTNLVEAQELYLQASYFEAERLVKKNSLGQNDDIESSLLWIAILRRTRRIPQALELISNVSKLDAAAPWFRELQSEKEQCLRIKIQAPPAHS